MLRNAIAAAAVGLVVLGGLIAASRHHLVAPNTELAASVLQPADPGSLPLALTPGGTTSLRHHLAVPA